MRAIDLHNGPPGWERVRHIDETDQKILRILQGDASISQETIAHEVGTSVGTVSNRIKRMREDGIITRFVPAIDARALGFDICALIDIRIAGGHMEEVQQAFCDHPNVCSIYDITGEYEYSGTVTIRDTVHDVSK